MKFFKKKIKQAGISNKPNGTIQGVKIKKRKNFVFRDFSKEIKRIKWPKPKDYLKLFILMVIFVIIVIAILYGIVIGFSTLFSKLGVGL